MTTPSPSAAAVIVAAGNSTRMAAGGVTQRKPWLELDGHSILEHTLCAFDAASLVKEIILVTHPDDVANVKQLAAENSAFAKVRGVVEGGAERADSVRRGVFWCGFEVGVIAVHDAARPLIEPATIDACVRAAAQDGAALVALAVRDTIKQRADGEPVRIGSTLDRSKLFAAQTPQAFLAKRFRELVARAEEEGLCPTDDSALWEHYEGPVTVIPGSPSNLKITSTEDLELAATMLSNRQREEHRS